MNLTKGRNTPFVLSFTSYPSIASLPPHFLIGAEFTLLSCILKTTEHDLE